MYLIASYSDSEVAKIICRKLESVGIFACMKRDGSKILGLGYESVNVYALSKEQQEDAISFISNPHHKISSKINKKQIEELHYKASYSVETKLNRFVFFALLVIAVFVLFFIYLVRSET